jgi:mannan endo-1,4-beta-mannosidase
LPALWRTTRVAETPLSTIVSPPFLSFLPFRSRADLPRFFRTVEPVSVGTYDDTILTKIDQLMVECKARGTSSFLPPRPFLHSPFLPLTGLKLLIALSDRYALGFWSTDSYALKLNIVTAGSTGVQKVANAASYYTSASAASWTDNRLKHIMQHKNAALGKTWAELDEVIYAVEPQNEPQGVRSLPFFLPS